jgi:uncharacterized protein
MKIERDETKVLQDRIEQDRTFIQVVVGARQIGKTTLIGQVLAKLTVPIINISADAVADSAGLWIDQQWENARLQLASTKAPYIVLAIDEIQKIMNWSESIKKNWDADTKNNIDIRVILSGSSKLLIHEGLTESLAGRFELIKLMHWSYAEMQLAFDVSEEEYAYFGAYPGAASLIKDEKRWRNYIKDSLIETTISKDILMMNRVDKPALLKQLFELGSMYSTNELSFTKIIGQLQNAGNTTTLSNYLNLLSGAHLLTGLQKFSGSQVLSRNSSPKFLVFNNAFFTVYQQSTFKKATLDTTQWGRWVESTIGAYLINQAVKYDYKLLYWRKGNDEVDFILQNQTKTIGIEVKSGSTLKSSGLQKAHALYKFDKVWLVGIEGLHWKDFIKMDLGKVFDY